MATYSSFKQLEAAIKERINQTLQNEVAQKIQETEQKHVFADVYAAYWPLPVMYKRRQTGGGLADVNNMHIENADMEVAVINQTTFNSGYGGGNGGNDLAMLVEHGDGGGGHHYQYPRAKDMPPYGDFHPARPFVERTYEELVGTHALRTALVSGLRKRGVDAS